MFPVYNGMFERKNDYSLMFAGPVSSRRNKTHKYTEYLSRYFKDFGRSIDYLETRNDIDSENRITSYNVCYTKLLRMLKITAYIVSCLILFSTITCSQKSRNNFV